MKHWKDGEYVDLQPSDTLLGEVSNTLGISSTTIRKLAGELLPIAHEVENGDKNY